MEALLHRIILNKTIEIGDKDNIDTMCIKIIYGADVNSYDRYGWTIMMYASMRRSIDKVRLLLRNGANPNRRSFRQVGSALTVASEYGDLEIVKLLLNWERNSDPRETDEKETITKVEINYTNHNGNTSLALAVMDKHIEVAKLLIRYGADINKANNQGRTPLMQVEDLESAKLLLENGAKIDRVDHTGKTALMFASHHGKKEIVKLLLEYKANTKIVDEDGRAAYDFAVLNGKLETARLLEEYEANV